MGLSNPYICRPLGCRNGNGLKGRGTSLSKQGIPHYDIKGFEGFRKARRESVGPQGRNKRLRSLSYLLLIASGARVLLEANAFGVLANWHPVVNGVAHLVPLTTLVLLTVFIVKHEDRWHKVMIRR